MGTYTTNYNLFMPTIGEQGWGDLVNGNFTTIDTAMKSLSNRMGTAEGNITSLDNRLDTVETYGSRITALEDKSFSFLSGDNILGGVYCAWNFKIPGVYQTNNIKTYTYKANPFTNEVRFTCHGNGSNQYPGTSYVKINGVTVCTASGANVTNTYTTTLNDGDTVYCYVRDNYSSLSYLIIDVGGWMVNG